MIVMMQHALLTVVENEKNEEPKKLKLSPEKVPHVYLYTPSLKKSWIRPCCYNIFH
jgi:hypothetical protein